MRSKGCIVFLSAFLLAGAASPVAFGQEPAALERAVRDDKVELAITAMGGSTGNAIRIAVRRKVHEAMRLTLTPGIVFKSTSGVVQNMAGGSIKGERLGENSYRPGAEIVLTDNERHNYIVEAYCLDFHKPNPESGDSFALAAPDPRAASILAAARKRSASIGAIQAAVWMSRESLSPEQIETRFPVKARDLGVARAVLAEVAEEANRQLRRQPDVATSDDLPAMRPGDVVFVANDETRLLAGDRVIAVLKAGTQVKVAKVTGKWIAVVVTDGGTKAVGWVNASDVKRAASLESAPNPP